MILSITDLTAGYAAGPAIIQNIKLELYEGEIVSIIGPNGAGKSTLLKSIVGLTHIQSGCIQTGEREITSLTPNEIIRSGIAFVSQGANTFAPLTVHENLLMGAYSLQNKNETQQALERVYNIFPPLKALQKTTAGLLSGGERQMVAISMALMLNPKLLLLDEPSIGLAPNLVTNVFQKIQEVRDAGTTVLMVEQNAITALGISDRAYVLERGKNAITGTGKALLADARVGELYLGKRH